MNLLPTWFGFGLACLGSIVMVFSGVLWMFGGPHVVPAILGYATMHIGLLMDDTGYGLDSSFQEGEGT